MEAVDIIQGLLAGEMMTFHGACFRRDHAKLFDRPKRKLDAIMAAGGPDAAKLAAQKTDGLIVTEPRKENLQRYVVNGGKGPRHAEVAMCIAASEEEGRKTAHRYFRWSLSGWPVLAELPHEEAFAAASEQVSVEAVGKALSCGPSVDRHLEAIERYAAVGCDHIILNQICPDQDSFFELCEKKILPALRGKKMAA